MAKKSKIVKNDMRKVIVERYAAKRLEIKKALVDPNGTAESREAARLGLQKLPRNASPVRVRGRDAIDGRRTAWIGRARWNRPMRHAHRHRFRIGAQPRQQAQLAHRFGHHVIRPGLQRGTAGCSVSGGQHHRRLRVGRPAGARRAGAAEADGARPRAGDRACGGAGVAGGGTRKRVVPIHRIRPTL